MEEPIDGVDYKSREYRYFSTPTVTMVSCLHCVYMTGKYVTERGALRAYNAHWFVKHRLDSSANVQAESIG